MKREKQLLIRISDEDKERIQAKMEEAGITVVRDVDYTAFKDALGDFYDSMKDSIGAKYVDDLFAAIG